MTRSNLSFALIAPCARAPPSPEAGTSADEAAPIRKSRRDPADMNASVSRIPILRPRLLGGNSRHQSPGGHRPRRIVVRNGQLGMDVIEIMGASTPAGSVTNRAFTCRSRSVQTQQALYVSGSPGTAQAPIDLQGSSATGGWSSQGRNFQRPENRHATQCSRARAGARNCEGDRRGGSWSGASIPAPRRSGVRQGAIGEGGIDRPRITRLDRSRTCVLEDGRVQ